MLTATVYQRVIRPLIIWVIVFWLLIARLFWNRHEILTSRGLKVEIPDMKFGSMNAAAAIACGVAINVPHLGFLDRAEMDVDRSLVIPRLEVLWAGVDDELTAVYRPLDVTTGQEHGVPHLFR